MSLIVTLAEVLLNLDLDFHAIDNLDLLTNSKFCNNVGSSDIVSPYGEVVITHSLLSGEVFQITCCDKLDRNPAYRWTREDLRDLVDPDEESFSEVFAHYGDTDCLDDILTKSNAILRNLKYDPTVVIHLDWEPQLIADFTEKAYQLGLTFDELLTKVLLDVIEREKINDDSNQEV